MTDSTDYTEGLVVDWIVGGQDMPTAHGQVYVALHTSDPSDTGEANELTASSYDRVTTTAGTDWDVSGSEYQNSVEIQFPTAQEDWGTVTHFSLWDGSESTDNALTASELESNVTIENGDEPVFRSGGITGEMD